MVLRKNRVIGGITYRLFEDRNFVEIVFCTVATDEQIHVRKFDLCLSIGIWNTLDESLERVFKESCGIYVDIC